MTSGLEAIGRAVLSAFLLMSTLPVRSAGLELTAQDFARANGFFPLVGAVIGLLVGAVWQACMALQLGQVGAALALACWLALTGMLHFDGLTDSADAVFSPKSPAERLDILKDVHMGAFGVGVGVVALLLKFSLLAQMQGWWWPALAAVSARACLLWAVRRYPAVRAGMGSGVRQGWWWLAATGGLGVLLVPLGWVALLGAGAATVLAAAYMARKLGGGLTGDGYGACIELAELGALLALQLAAGAHQAAGQVALGVVQVQVAG